MREVQSLLVTGGAGFIGSNFIHSCLADRPEVRVVNLDKLTYAGNLANLQDVERHPSYRFVRGDIADRQLVQALVDELNPSAIVNFAAESHVDRSILDAAPFIETNVRGTQALLDVARAKWENHLDQHLFLQVSTDEVYGDLGPTGSFIEESPLAPNSPYSASKAAGDLLCRAYYRTYRLPVVVTRCTNNYGPYQFPEKLIPMMILRASRGQKLPVYGDGKNVRDWIHVADHCRALALILLRGRPGEVYNIGAGCELQNIDVVRRLLTQLGKGEDLVEFVRDRPGHDRRYALDCRKIATELGWRPTVSFGDGLDETISWYAGHPEWIENCLTGEYRSYYDANYGRK